MGPEPRLFYQGQPPCKHIWVQDPLGSFTFGAENPSYHSMSPTHKAQGKGHRGLACNEYRNKYRDSITAFS